ncbi:hypothetical protein T05_13199 [Trichinella murrelli]|uniref:Uncharacterized protein n=1 Tax=Trichinella murrelli TaxID=144512 RepID=A0A0V0TY39_9BILA|nr:hypothetical protein T05_13199 [Trichinella murrelli]
MLYDQFFPKRSAHFPIWRRKKHLVKKSFLKFTDEFIIMGMPILCIDAEKYFKNIAMNMETKIPPNSSIVISFSYFPEFENNRIVIKQSKG